MPNWCDTTYKIVGPENDLHDLLTILEQMESRKKTVVENGFGIMWLGELVNGLGFDWDKYRCRGEITGYELDEGVLSIWQETAWCEQEGVRHAIEEKYPNLKVYYSAEEPGCEVYCTNDMKGDFFPDNYFLDAYNDPQYFETIGEAAKYVESLVGHEVEASVSSIQHALDDYAEIRQENDEDVFYSFHEFTRLED